MHQICDIGSVFTDGCSRRRPCCEACSECIQELVRLQCSLERGQGDLALNQAESSSRKESENAGECPMRLLGQCQCDQINNESYVTFNISPEGGCSTKYASKERRGWLPKLSITLCWIIVWRLWYFYIASVFVVWFGDDWVSVASKLLGMHRVQLWMRCSVFIEIEMKLYVVIRIEQSKFVWSHLMKSLLQLQLMLCVHAWLAVNFLVSNIIIALFLE